MNIAQLLPALLRTIVPLVYGLLIRAGLGQYLPDGTVTTLATVVVLAGVYLLLRILEHLQPWIGVLLGWAKQPQYAGVVQGQVLAARDEVETIGKADLAQLGAQLRDELAAVIEEKVTASVSALPRAAAAKKTTRVKSTAAKAATARAAAKTGKAR